MHPPSRWVFLNLGPAHRDGADQGCVDLNPWTISPRTISPLTTCQLSLEPTPSKLLANQSILCTPSNIPIDSFNGQLCGKSFYRLYPFHCFYPGCRVAICSPSASKITIQSGAHFLARGREFPEQAAFVGLHLALNVGVDICQRIGYITNR
jgi:hypothetical protein